MFLKFIYWTIFQAGAIFLSKLHKTKLPDIYLMVEYGPEKTKFNIDLLVSLMRTYVANANDTV